MVMRGLDESMLVGAFRVAATEGAEGVWPCRQGQGGGVRERAAEDDRSMVYWHSDCIPYASNDFPGSRMTL